MSRISGSRYFHSHLARTIYLACTFVTLNSGVSAGPNPNHTTWVGNVSKTRLSIQGDSDARRVCPAVCSSAGAGRSTGRWRKHPLQVFQGNQFQGIIGYYDSSCECQKIVVSKQSEEYDYVNRYGNNPAYDKLGKDAQGYTEIVRAFKAKHPDKFDAIVKSLRDDLRRYSVSQVVTPSDNSILWRLNTDAAQRLIRANMNIKTMHNPYATPKPEPGWLTEQQAVAIILQQADRP